MGTMGKAFYSVGFWIRETGQALDRLGCRLQGKNHFREQLSRHRTLMNVFDKTPNVDKGAFVAPNASLSGDVHVGRGSSIWYGCVLRGDANSISVGAGTNIQDNALVHVAKTNLSGKVLPTVIGDNVTIGHSAVLHGCTVEDEAYIGTSATVLDGAHVEKHAMVASGALVRQNTRIPSGEVWGGNPAKFLRKVTEEERVFFSSSAVEYSNLAQAHATENAKNLDELKAMEASPPPVFPRSNGKIQKIVLPEDPYVRKFANKHPGTKIDDPAKISAFIPDQARVYGCRVLELKEHGISEGDAMSVANMEYLSERKEMKKAYKRLKELAVMQDKDPPPKPYPSAKKGLITQSKTSAKDRFQTPSVRRLVNQLKNEKDVLLQDRTGGSANQDNWIDE